MSYVTLAQNATLAPYVPTELNPFVSIRKGMVVQLLTPGYLWIQIGVQSGPGVGAGFRVGYREVVDLGVLMNTRVGNGVDFLTVQIWGTWEPGNTTPAQVGIPPLAAVRTYIGLVP